MKDFLETLFIQGVDIIETYSTEIPTQPHLMSLNSGTKKGETLRKTMEQSGILEDMPIHTMKLIHFVTVKDIMMLIGSLRLINFTLATGVEMVIMIWTTIMIMHLIGHPGLVGEDMMNFPMTNMST